MDYRTTPRTAQGRGAFVDLQRAYAEHHIATYPLTQEKIPAIRGYGSVDVAGSHQLAMKFPEAMAAGFIAGHRNRLTVIDIDSPDDRLLDEMQGMFGATPLHVRTPSGGRHLYYRHGGEARRIRPLPNVDILGAGNVVAALSVVPKGRYELERGSLDDLAALPPIRQEQQRRPAGGIPEGQRNNGLFKYCLRCAPSCDDLEALLDVARTLNMELIEPLPDIEVIKTAKSAWAYQVTGRNWVGRKARASTDREEILAMSRDPAAAMLLMLLRVSHPLPDDRFAVDQIKTAKLLSWDRKTLRAKIDSLIACRRLKRVHFGSGKHDPHLYVLDGGRGEKGDTI